MNLQWKHILILIFSAVLAELAFAPFNQFYTAFFALVPLLYILDRCKNGFLTGFIWGFFYSLFSIHWLAFNTGTYWWVATFSMLLASVFLALNYAVIGFFFTWMRKRNTSFAFFLFPFIWVAVEFLRSFGTLGFPWLALGHSQAYNTLYVQTADIGGVYTVSFLLLLTNLFLYLLFRSYSRQRLTALLLIIMIPYLYGIMAMNTDMQSGEKLNFRIIQPNIGGKEKWEPSNRVAIMNKMDSLSRVETGIAPDVIVWPETAVPFYLRSSRYYKNIILRCARDMRSTVITGSLDYFFPDTVSRYSSTNSIFIFEPGVKDYQDVVYDKIHLVPFGEFTPGGEYFTWMNNMEYGQSDFTTRKKVRVMHMGKDSVIFTPMICYDSVFPHTIRRAAAEGSRYNILITNDIWFGRSIGPHQHAAIAILRAVETRRPLIRSANAGISMFIDAKGRVKESLPLYTSGLIDQELSAGEHVSPYVRTGNLFSWIISIISLTGICFLLCVKRKK